MRGHLILPLASIFAHHLTGVDRQALVGVDSHTEQAGVGLLKWGRKGENRGFINCVSITDFFQTK